MRQFAFASALAFALLASAPAQAHLVNSGLGPFYDGALHLLLTPMDLVALATLGLFAGMRGVDAGRVVVVTAPFAWLAAGLAALASGFVGSFALVDAASLIVLGGSVALGLAPPPPVAAIAAAVVSALLGFRTGMEVRLAGGDWIVLLGTAVVALAIVLLATACVVSVTSFGLRVVVRVLGSWAAATGLLSIGWLAAAVR